MVTRQVLVRWVHQLDRRDESVYSVKSGSNAVGPRGCRSSQRDTVDVEVTLDNRDGRYSVMLAGSQHTHYFPTGYIACDTNYSWVRGETLRQFTGEVVDRRAPRCVGHGGEVPLRDISYALQQMKPVTAVYTNQR
jgi:hypothetical protein